MESVLTDHALAPPVGGGPDSGGPTTFDPVVGAAIPPGFGLPVELEESGEPGGAESAGTVPHEAPLASGLVADLHDPRLVLSPGYIGTDRRATGAWAWLRRATFGQRRSVLRLEIAVLAAIAVVVTATVMLVNRDPRASSATTAAVSTHRAPSDVHAAAPAVTAPAVTAPASTTPTTAPPATTPTTAPPAPVTPAAAPPVTPVTTPPVSDAALTPTQMGAQALALVRYPWQSIPGYSIQFQPIADAPSPSFYGNTTFTWGQAGGTSVLYVYPGESVETLAGITAFEIGHEVDAAAVEPQGGEAQIENILGIHPASWAPNCDCAEQGFLSGWYAAAFSNYWSPGVGNWSALASEPSGATLAAVEPWLDPTIH